MTLRDRIGALDLARAGAEMHALVEELYPICRSITGDGFRRTLDRLGQVVPLERTEIPSGTSVLDWTVPREWNVREAWVRGPDGRTVADVRDHTLHLVSYSVPFRGTVPLRELQPHLHSLPDRPDRIPYRTSYYADAWGFCLTDRVRASLPEGDYEVCVDTTLEDGALTYAEHVVPGVSRDEVLLSVHGCHPSLANDNLSSLAVATRLAASLSGIRTHYTYRLLIAPGTIGAIAWLSRHRDRLDRIAHGLVLTCLGDRGPFHYKRTRAGDAPIDRVVEHVVVRRDPAAGILAWEPYGYDERQYNSPGFRLPVGRLSRAVHGTFPEYHTSADDLAFVAPEALAGSLDVLLDVVEVLEDDRTFRNRMPFGEPQLGRRGIYGALGGLPDPGDATRAMLWVLGESDGESSLLDIATRSGLPFRAVAGAAAVLREHRLIEPIDDRPDEGGR